MAKNVINTNSFFSKVITLAIFLTLSFSLSALPLVIKSVDSEWLPMLAQSWEEKNGGVFVSIEKNIDGKKLREIRDKINLMFENSHVEIRGRRLFFPQARIDTLFEYIKDVDLGFDDLKRSSLNENSALFIKKSADDSKFSKDELVQAVVEKVELEHETGRLTVTVKIQQKAKTGDFTRLSGRFRIEYVFAKRDNKIDETDEENKKFTPLMLMNSGDKISFIPVKQEGRVLTISYFVR